MKKSLGAILAGAALAWSGAAFAITQTSTVTVTETGKPIPTATVTITVKETPKATPRAKRPPPRVVDRTTVKSDPQGRISLTYDDDKWRKDMVVDFSIVTADGRRLTRTNVPMSSLVSGNPIDVPTRTATPRRAFRVAESAAPVPQDRVFFNYNFFMGGHAIPNSTGLTIIETVAATGQESNRFERRDGGIGGGFTLGLAPANPGGPDGLSPVLTPFVSFDFPNNTVEERFSPVSFIGERVIFVGTAGLQLGRMIAPNFQIYGLAGLSLVNKEFTIDFGGPIRTTESQWLFGGTLGAGLSFQPQGWTFLGRPVILFAQYQHVFVQDGEVNQPAVSPAFNYRFENDLDIFKFGVNIPLGQELRY
jgi:hypothetical protein